MNKKWWAQKTFWTSAAGVVASCFALWAALDPHHAVQIGVAASAIAAFLGNIGSVFARAGGVEAAKDAAGLKPNVRVSNR